MAHQITDFSYRMVGKGYWSLKEPFALENLNSFTRYVSGRLAHSGSIKPLFPDTRRSREPVETKKNGRPFIAGWARPRTKTALIADGTKCRIWNTVTGELSDPLDRQVALELVQTLNVET